MPDKSRYQKGKHPHHSKKSKAIERRGAVVSSRPVAADTPTPAAATSATPPSRAPASPAKSRAAQYPYITSELRRIFILGGIILVILIVLSQVLS